MSRLRSLSGLTLVACGLALLAVTASACGEDGKTAPDICAEPPLPIYDVQNPTNEGGAPNPCVTRAGHAISGIITSSGGTGNSAGTANAAAGKN